MDVYGQQPPFVRDLLSSRIASNRGLHSDRRSTGHTHLRFSYDQRVLFVLLDESTFRPGFHLHQNERRRRMGSYHWHDALLDGGRKFAHHLQPFHVAHCSMCLLSDWRLLRIGSVVPFVWKAPHEIFCDNHRWTRHHDRLAASSNYQYRR